MNKILEWLKKALGLTLDDTNPVHINTTGAQTDLNGYAITALAETTFTVFNCTNVRGNDDLVSSTLPAGITIYVKVKDITIASGGDILVYTKK